MSCLNLIIKITMMHWLHDAKIQAKHSQEINKVKTKETLLVYCLMHREIQHRTIKSKIIIDTQLYEVRLFNSNVLT